MSFRRASGTASGRVKIERGGDRRPPRRGGSSRRARPPRDGRERRRIEGPGELEPIAARRVVLRHRGNAENRLDRRENRGGRVLPGIDLSARRVGRDDEDGGAVAIDVVRTVLGVVLENENRGVGEIAAVGHRLDQPPEREVVLGRHRLRREGSCAGPRRVVVREVRRSRGAATLPSFRTHGTRAAIRPIRSRSLYERSQPRYFGSNCAPRPAAGAEAGAFASRARNQP